MNSRFGQGAVVVGLLPEQDPAVLKFAVELAAATGAALMGAYVDPGSYLIGDLAGNVLGESLDRVLDPEDEAALAVLELGPLLTAAAEAHMVTSSIRVLGGETALALDGWPRP